MYCAISGIPVCVKRVQLFAICILFTSKIVWEHNSGWKIDKINGKPNNNYLKYIGMEHTSKVGKP